MTNCTLLTTLCCSTWSDSMSGIYAFLLCVIVDELTDEKLWELSKHITCASDLHRLCFALGISYHELAAVLYAYRDGINVAAFELLRQWQKSQPNSKNAYSAMCKALKEARMPYAIHALKWLCILSCLTTVIHYIRTSCHSHVFISI